MKYFILLILFSTMVTAENVTVIIARKDGKPSSFIQCEVDTNCSISPIATVPIISKQKEVYKIEPVVLLLTICGIVILTLIVLYSMINSGGEKWIQA